MNLLNLDKGQCRAYAPPLGEVTTLTAQASAAWPAGVRLIVGADRADVTPTVLGTAVLSDAGMLATWALSEADCVILRAHTRIAVQVPSGAAWVGVLAGPILPMGLWTGSAQALT